VGFVIKRRFGGGTEEEEEEGKAGREFVMDPN